MDELLRKMGISQRLLQGAQKEDLALYIEGQRQTLANIAAGRPYILCTYYVPSELLQLFDVEVLYIERIVGLAAGTGQLQGAADGALPPKVCSYHTAFLDLMTRGVLPYPKLLVAMQYPCPDAVLLMRHLHEAYHVPLFTAHTGRLQKDLLALARLLSEQFRKKRSEMEVTLLYRQACRLKEEADRIRLARPGIVTSGDAMKLFTVENDFGNEQAVAVLRAFVHRLHGLEKNWVCPQEKRLLWMGLIPLYDNNVFTKIPGLCGYIPVFEEMWMFHKPLYTTENFYTHLAWRVEQSLFYHFERRLAAIDRVVSRVQIQMIVHFSQKNCSFLPPYIPRLRNHFKNNAVKHCFLCADVVEKGNFKEEELYAAIQKADREDSENSQ